MLRYPIIRQLERELRAKLRVNLIAQQDAILRQLSGEVEAARETREPITMELTITLEIQPTL